MEFLGGEKREAVAEVEAHLMSEHTPCSGAGAVASVGPFIHYSIQKVEILSHFVDCFVG